jgi:hypothetical protein
MGVLRNVHLSSGGTYELDFHSFQLFGYQYGLQYAGQVDLVPEPSTLLLVGAGFALTAMASRRRKR